MFRKFCWLMSMSTVFVVSKAFAEVKNIQVSSKMPTEINLPAGTELIAISIDATEWSHDPLAGLQNLLMLPGVSVRIPADDKTMEDIKELVSSGKILVRGDLLTKALSDIEGKIGGTEKAVTLKGDKGDYGWVVSEIWKKYLFKRNPKLGIGLSYLGPCGEKGNIAAAKGNEPVFLGEFPGIGLPAGGLIATVGNLKSVQFCRGGDRLFNDGKKDVKVILQINDDQPADNSGYIELKYELVSKSK